MALIPVSGFLTVYNSTDLFLDLQLEVAEVLLQLALPLGSLLSCQLQPQLRICLERAHTVLVLIQQMLHLLLVHLCNSRCAWLPVTEPIRVTSCLLDTVNLG